MTIAQKRNLIGVFGLMAALYLIVAGWLNREPALFAVAVAIDLISMTCIGFNVRAARRARKTPTVS